ncbi:MAG: hypothetical protein WCW03_01245 [Candidatus Paceibacterota bacterium]|jgi:hypothetical protein
MKKKNLNIPKPSPEEVQYYLNFWDSNADLKLSDSSLKYLFSKTYPQNNNLEEVLIKVCTLKSLFGLIIFSPITVAKHIISLEIDSKFLKDDLMIVNEIASVNISTNRIINFYSFATKYCSFHKPNIYLKYDYHVSKLLKHHEQTDKFDEFTEMELRYYDKYHEVFINFRKKYGLDLFSLEQIERYLYLAGKKYFPQNY